MYKNCKIRSGAALLHKLSYSWLQRLQNRQRKARWIKTALRKGIYRQKKRCTWTRSTNRRNLTKDTMKRQNSMKEDSSVKEQHSRTSISKRIFHKQQYNPWRHALNSPTTRMTTAISNRTNNLETYEGSHTKLQCQRITVEKELGQRKIIHLIDRRQIQRLQTAKQDRINSDIR